MPTSNPYAAVFGSTAGQADPNLDPQSQQMLDAALQHGGAVAQVASEATHPNGSFIQLAYQKLGQGFQGLMDTLAIPEDAVTALLSQGTNAPHSFQEVRQLRLSPSDVLFGKPNTAGMGIAAKVGITSARFITDVLLDPLTYLTFGEGEGLKGLFGLSKLTSIPVKPETARALGYDAKDLIEGTKGAETVEYHALSAKGMVAKQTTQAAIETQIQRDTLERFGYDPRIGKLSKAAPGLIDEAPAIEGGAKFVQANNIWSRVQRRAVSLIGASSQDFAKVMSTTRGAENIAASSLHEWAGANGLLGKAVGDLTTEERDAWTAATQQATKKAMDDQAERLVKHTIGARKSEIEAAAKDSLSNLIEQNVSSDGVILDKLGRPVLDQFGNKMVRNLAQEYLDKGGIKFFGSALVTGAKLRAFKNMLLPSLDTIEAKFGYNTANALRGLVHTSNIVRSGFSTKWNEGGRIPDSAIALMEKAKNRSSSEATAVVSALPKLWDKLGITKADDKALSWMIAADMPPATGDARYETIYNLLHSPNGQQTAVDIANGKFGDDAAKIWQAATAIRDTNKRSLLAMHESGMAAFPQKNYISNMLNEPKNVIRPFTKFKTSEAVNASKAEINKWRNVEDPSKVLYGDEKSLQLTRFNKAEEVSRVSSQLDREVLSNTQKREAISGEIEKAWGSIQDKMAQAILKPSSKLLRGISGGDNLNYEAIQRVIQDAVPQVDRNRIMKDYVSKAYEDGRRIITEARLSPEDITKLKEDLASGDLDLDHVATGMMAHASELAVKAGKEGAEPAGGAGSKDAYQKALQKLMSTVMENGVEGKKRYIQEAMSKDQGFKDVISGLSEEWTKNPEGIQKTLESILGKNFDMESLMQDLEDTKTGLAQELASPGLKQVAGRWFYKDTQGATYERLRASAAAINQNMFDAKEMFTESALKQTLSEALNVIRTTNTKYLLDDIASKFGIGAKSAPSNYVKVGIADLSEKAPGLSEALANNAQTGFAKAGGEELYYHPTVANAINDMMKVMEKDPASSALLTSYDTLTNFWKASVTSIFPMFHGRNAVSNVFQNMMNIGFEAMNPVNHMLSSKLILHNHQLEGLAEQVALGTNPDAFKKMMDLSKQVILTDKSGYEWTAGELNRVIRDNVIAFNPSVLGNMDTQRSSKQMLTELEDHLYPDVNKYVMPVKKYFSSKYTPFALGRSVGQNIESQARMVNFIANLRETGDVEHAAQMTKQALFDYQNLTPFEKNAVRRVIPFYTYTRKNVELMANTLLHQPGRIDSFRNAIQNIGDVFGGGNLSDQERAMLPSWMRDGLTVVLGRQGEKVSLLTSLQTPIEQPFQALSTLYGSMNPLIKLPIEQTTGYSFFYGKPLSQVTNADAYSSAAVPQAIRDFIGYTQYSYIAKDGTTRTLNVALKPMNMNILQNLPLTPRILSILKNMQGADPAKAQFYMTNLFGVTPQEIDLQTEATARQKEIKASLENILSKAGIGYTYTNFHINTP